MKDALIYIATFLNSVGYILYIVQVKKGKSDPKLASWGLWTFLSTLNFLSYREMNGSWLETLQFFSDAVWCLIVSFYMMYLGKFLLILVELRKDLIVFLIGCFSILAYWEFRNAEISNLIVCFALIISFIPTISGVKKDPFTESSASWYFCTLAYFLTATFVLCLDKSFKIMELLDPIILFFLHAVVAFLATKKVKK